MHPNLGGKYNQGRLFSLITKSGLKYIGMCSAHTVTLLSNVPAIIEGKYKLKDKNFGKGKK